MHAFVRRFLDQYRERHKESSHDTARASLRRFANDFEGRPLGAIDASEAEEWARANPWRVPVVVTLFNAAIRKRVVDHNPFAGLSRKGPGRRDDDPLTEEEVYRLAGCAETAHGPYGPVMRAFVLFTAGTGMRAQLGTAVRAPKIIEGPGDCPSPDGQGCGPRSP